MKIRNVSERKVEREFWGGKVGEQNEKCTRLFFKMMCGGKREMNLILDGEIKEVSNK